MPTNRFIDTYLPTLFWPAQIATFGSAITYLPQGDPAKAVNVSVLWKDGQSDEDVAPGRFSHIDVRDADLPASPAPRDVVQKGGRQFQVVRVQALAVGFSIAVLQEWGAVA